MRFHDVGGGVEDGEEENCGVDPDEGVVDEEVLPLEDLLEVLVVPLLVHVLQVVEDCEEDESRHKDHGDLVRLQVLEEQERTLRQPQVRAPVVSGQETHCKVKQRPVVYAVDYGHDKLAAVVGLHCGVVKGYRNEPNVEQVDIPVANLQHSL